MNTINVTRSYLPPYKKYEKYLKRLWKSRWLTNEGEFAKELEFKLNKFLGVKHLRIVANGTLALQLSLRSLNITGEVITTPFSYVASSASIKWEGLKPVFADIDPETLNIDPKNIIRLINKNTRAILAVHVFGNPCAVNEIEKIAKAYKLKVIYDSAHAFGVRINNKPIIQFGDSNALSFHATKIFHTIEGGAVVSKLPKVNKKVGYLRYFGHSSPYTFYGLGTNAKMSEFHAAMGLCLLNEFNNIRKKREAIASIYDKYLKSESISFPKFDSGVQRNYAYYPIIFLSEKKLKKTEHVLNNSKVFPRRYFYPSLNKLGFLNKSKCKISEDISSRIMCLPLFDSLTFTEVKKICHLVTGSL